MVNFLPYRLFFSFFVACNIQDIIAQSNGEYFPIATTDSYLAEGEDVLVVCETGYIGCDRLVCTGDGTFDPAFPSCIGKIVGYILCTKRSSHMCVINDDIKASIILHSNTAAAYRPIIIYCKSTHC